MNWRPSDWENPYLKAGKNLPDFTSKAILYSILRNAYEEGADAILGALKKENESNDLAKFAFEELSNLTAPP